MKVENEVLKEFYLLSDYLKKERKIEDLNRYKKDFSAFLLHASHIKSYDFVAPFCKNKKVLDIGCFIGYGETRIFSQATEIVAIDSDDNALEFARQNRTIPNTRFEKIDAERLPFSNETFDIVIAFQLIEHISPNEVGNFLSEVKRVSKENGLLFIVTPNRKFRLMPFQRPWNPEHYQEFTAKALLKILKTTFVNVQIMGIRAKDWIEEIERRRVRRGPYQAYICNPYQAYIRDPLFGVLSKIFPQRVKALVKNKILTNNTESILIPVNDKQFNNPYQKFSMDDFYLERREDLIDKSLSFFAICKNDKFSKEEVM